MKDASGSTVLFCPTEADDFGVQFQKKFSQAVVHLAEGLKADESAPWAVKISLGAPDKNHFVPAELMVAAKSALQQSGLTTGPFFDTISITTEGLETAAGLTEQAKSMELEEFQVGDDPEGLTSETLKLSEDCSQSAVNLSAVASEAGGLMLINAVRPHPFLGLGGAMLTLGNGLMDRATKLALHRDVKPTVDTPLCAGCGSCLSSCLVGAIAFSSGRAMIDHKLCTGCGECMGACHLGGIGPESGMSIPRFQKLVAESAGAAAMKSKAGQAGSLLYINVLAPLSSQAGGSYGRDRFLKGQFGALVSTDPVALDQATWDLLIKGAVHGLRQWSGFLQEPTPLMERAVTLGIGRRSYELIIQN